MKNCILECVYTIDRVCFTEGKRYKVNSKGILYNDAGNSVDLRIFKLNDLSSCAFELTASFELVDENVIVEETRTVYRIGCLEFLTKEEAEDWIEKNKYNDTISEIDDLMADKYIDGRFAFVGTDIQFVKDLIKILKKNNLVK